MKQLILIFILSGCAGAESINPLGRGTYLATYHDRSFTNSEGGAIEGAVVLANKECSKAGKEAVVESTSTTPKWLMTFPSAQVQFKCE